FTWLSLPEHREELFRHNVADAFRGTATAGVFAIVFRIVSVIEGQFFSGSNLAPGDNPDLPLDIFGVAVRSATVIEEAGRVPAHATIDVPFVVQFKNERVAGFATANGFGFRYLFAEILDQQLAGANRRGGISPKPVNCRRSEFQYGLEFLFRHRIWKRFMAKRCSQTGPGIDRRADPLPVSSCSLQPVRWL